MAIRNLTTTAAMLALIASAGGAALAQTAPPQMSGTQTAETQTAETGTAPAQAAPAGEDLPAPLASLKLNTLRIETLRDGMREIEGTTPEGVDIEARLDRAGNLVEAEADDGVLPAPLVEWMLPPEARGHASMALFGSIREIERRRGDLVVEGRQPDGGDMAVAFDPEGRLTGIEMEGGAVPDALSQSLLPQPVRDSDVIEQFARIERIATRDGRVMLGGEDAAGADLRAMLDGEGRLLRFGRDDEDRSDPRDRGPGAPGHDRDDHDRDGHQRGDHDRGGHDRGDHGRGDHGRGDHAQGRHGPAGTAPGDHGPGKHRAGDDARGQAPAPIAPETASVHQALSRAGYTQMGPIRAQGPRLTLEATNPQGEPVTLDLDPSGEVVAETAR